MVLLLPADGYAARDHLGVLIDDIDFGWASRPHRNLPLGPERLGRSSRVRCRMAGGVSLRRPGRWLRRRQDGASNRREHVARLHRLRRGDEEDLLRPVGRRAGCGGERDGARRRRGVAAVELHIEPASEARELGLVVDLDRERCPDAPG